MTHSYVPKSVIDKQISLIPKAPTQIDFKNTQLQPKLYKFLETFQEVTGPQTQIILEEK